ncbi:uncharacterized protein KQ657_005005 [Scheffersomyces spartinae]|uniref:Lariat debranching enzyme C-terminal domain-containing protein n=1 Tax=Scheffersomyces spartinae TaxID=45513 RepID=A0A9P8AIE1_9ASCO|nr:uncharacterized protein KQ657_005005 [Scheffersomyces spartinae]KAG7194278.1 hypothetical protein KQ657_005005 [Scheffersomyces spartinae]
MVHIAVEGCCHGQLNKIYSMLISSQVDLLLICGDFQAIRNRGDLQGMAVPAKYLQLGDFHEYYSGKRTAPVLTVFIGGNHESSSYLKELKYGGWVAPNIYFLGEYGTIWFRGLKISGLSGIYNSKSFLMNYYKDEILPYTEKSIRTVYHVNPKNTLKMLLEETPGDIVLSHDWPQGIELLGDSKRLFQTKPHFRADSIKGYLGSPVNKCLLQYLKPRYWFLSHMHVRYRVKFKHQLPSTQTQIPTNNKDLIDLDMDDDDINPEKIELDMESEDEDLKPSATKQTVSSPAPKRDTTEFLALDKCLPKRKYLEFLDIEPVQDHPSILHPDSLFYDRRSICINKVVETFIVQNEKEWKSLNSRSLIGKLPEKTPIYIKLMRLIAKELESEIKFADNDVALRIPENFEIIAPTLSQEKSDLDHKQVLTYWPNNQTEQYCKTFGIPNIKYRW